MKLNSSANHPSLNGGSCTIFTNIYSLFTCYNPLIWIFVYFSHISMSFKFLRMHIPTSPTANNLTTPLTLDNMPHLPKGNPFEYWPVYHRWQCIGRWFVDSDEECAISGYICNKFGCHAVLLTWWIHSRVKDDRCLCNWNRLNKNAGEGRLVSGDVWKACCKQIYYFLT